MLKKLLLFLSLCVLSVSLQAEDVDALKAKIEALEAENRALKKEDESAKVETETAQDYKTHISLAVSLTPSESSEDLSGTVFDGYIDTASSHYQVNYIRERSNALGGFFNTAKSAVDYYSLRSIQRVIRFEGDDGADTAYSQKMLAFIYGRRYFLTSKSFDGLGYGWYVGLAKVVEEGYRHNTALPSSDPNSFYKDSDPFDGIQPVGAAELFYMIDIVGGLYAEATLFLGWNSEQGDTAFMPHVFVGYEF